MAQICIYMSDYLLHQYITADERRGCMGSGTKAWPIIKGNESWDVNLDICFQIRCFKSINNLPPRSFP